MIHYIALFISVVLALWVIWNREHHFNREYILFKKRYGIFFGSLIYVITYWVVFEFCYWIWFVWLK